MTRRICFLDRGTFADGVMVADLPGSWDWDVYKASSEDQAKGRVRDATIVITNKVPIGLALLDEAPNLKVVGVAATGVDCIDMDACKERGIAVMNVTEYATHTVPEHTFALILGLMRNIRAYHTAVLDRSWSESGAFSLYRQPIHELYGKTLGIVGEGHIGQAVSDIGKVFGMRTLFAAHKGRSGLGPLYTPWDDVLAQSDVITLHAPLTRATDRLLGATEFNLMQRKPIVVNTARGRLIDQDALIQALDAGKVSGCGLDVFDEEPPADVTKWVQACKRHNVIVTPHVAWAAEEAQQRLMDLLMEKLSNWARSQ